MRLNVLSFDEETNEMVLEVEKLDSVSRMTMNGGELWRGLSE